MSTILFRPALCLVLLFHTKQCVWKFRLQMSTILFRPALCWSAYQAFHVMLCLPLFSLSIAFIPPKTENRLHFGNFVVTGGTDGCHSNNLGIVAMTTTGVTSDDKVGIMATLEVYHCRDFPWVFFAMTFITSLSYVTIIYLFIALPFSSSLVLPLCEKVYSSVLFPIIVTCMMVGLSLI